VGDLLQGELLEELAGDFPAKVDFAASHGFEGRWQFGGRSALEQEPAAPDFNACNTYSSLGCIERMDSGELQGVFQQSFLPSKHAKTASLVIFSREDNRRAGSRGPVTLSHHSPESSRETLFEVEPPFAAL
jgi:hypothetical protein